MEINYNPTSTARKFHASKARVRALVGPLGCGKTYSCVAEILRLAVTAQPNDHGVRQTSVLVIRESYSALQDTTIKSFQEIFQEGWGNMIKMPPTYTLKKKLDDGTSIDLTVHFRSLNSPDSYQKILSLNITFCYINEAVTVSKPAFEMALSRCGRFPARAPGFNPRSGMILDTNACSVDHWFHKLFIEDRPEGYEVFVSPSGLSEEAENTEHLMQDYYEQLCIGKTQLWIDRYVHAKFIYLPENEPVFPDFVQELHTGETEIAVGEPVVVGVDYGLNAGIVIGQYHKQEQQYQIQREIATFNRPMSTVTDELKRILISEYPDSPTRIYGDPGGHSRSAVDGITVVDLFTDAGLYVQDAPTNAIEPRLESVSKALVTLNRGKPQLLIDRAQCPALVKAMTGGYCYERKTGPLDEYKATPKKDENSHIADALQYFMVSVTHFDSKEEKYVFKPDPSVI